MPKTIEIPKIIKILTGRLETLMEERKLKNYELANLAHIHHVTISKILNRKMPQLSLEVVHKLAKALGVTIEDLTGERQLYPEQDRKILAVREQFEKYGYESADAIIKLIPNLTQELQAAKTAGQETKTRGKTKLNKNKISRVDIESKIMQIEKESPKARQDEIEIKTNSLSRRTEEKASEKRKRKTA